MALISSCSDPGVVNIFEDTHSQNAKMRALDLNEEEYTKFMNNDDHIY